ncbi:MAG: deoxyribose-phosphate aldolase [Bacteroidetes bacterium SW_11_45_7]|nr:MAG: deoxyribose-phosphate aldolase [Bacteroidetes bacterium SW_11_45_7]
MTPLPGNNVNDQQLIYTPGTTVDEQGVHDRLDRILTRSIKKEAKVEGLKLVLSMIDLTTLEGSDTAGKVRQLCYKAAHLHAPLADLPPVGAVCVYPTLVPVAQEALQGTDVHVASVATGFPSGLTSRKVKIDETKYAVEQGADEVDMVISRNKFLAGDYNYVYDEIAAVKEACGDAHLKVILETGELSTLDNVRKASEIAMLAGADFIKTSTGKVKPAATFPVVLTMLEAIRDHYYKTGTKIGMKPAGGIKTAKDALRLLVMIKETLGEDWLNPELFRIGASSLANDVLMQIEKERTGAYQSLDYFSKD